MSQSDEQTTAPDTRYMTDNQRAFHNYKEATKKHGKAFFPHGIWHDAIASLVTVLIVILLAVIWFSQANCGRTFDINCKQAATPKQQADNHPWLGALYEAKADPSTTKYDPRPDWYFDFLFDLLRIFKNPQTVVLATIIIPTLALLLLLVWPFIDRKKERRPTRRPLAMAGMVATAVICLGLTYKGVTAPKPGEGGGPANATSAQQAMPGYKILFGPGASPACSSCHTMKGAWGATVGPNLTLEGQNGRGLAWQIAHLNDPQSKSPGSGMPSFKGTYTPQQIAQIAGFLETLGEPQRATDPNYINPNPNQGKATGTATKPAT